MKKLLYIFISILLFSCSSEESKDDSNNSDTTNFVEFKGDKYYLDEASVTREHDGNATSFAILFKDSKNTHIVSLVLSTSKSNTVPCPTCPNENIIDATYKLKTTAFLKGIALIKTKGESGITLISSADLKDIQNPSRVTVNSNSDGTYSFNFSIISPAGDLTGEYMGEIKKVNY